MQIILDKRAAVNYIVKYATIGEKAGLSLFQVYKEVIGKRDIGQCEVSRLLLSEPLYNSSFNYVTVSTEIDTRDMNLNKANEESVCKKDYDFLLHLKDYTPEQFTENHDDFLNIPTVTKEDLKREPKTSVQNRRTLL
ncbi:unnamed protein product [Brachionus calyciflorus]|uniref:Uncharacterized protein n=1 Tax=Brachionus calyciflorus TaxID=104777 RepID=A0A814DJ13_9BILA|nr:unnamed protein product [Brachionus calyciflorus]